MNKKTIALLLVMLMLTQLLTGCFLDHTEEKLPQYAFLTEGDYEVIKWEDVTLKIEQEYLTKDDKNFTAMMVDSGRTAARNYLEGWPKQPVELELKAGDGATMVYEGLAQVYFAQNRDIPYTSLITQVMAGVDGVADWIREGVGAYVADINKESMLDTQGHMIDCLVSYRSSLQKSGSGESQTEAPYLDIDTLAHVMYQNQAYTDALEFGDLAEAISSIGYAQEAYNYRGAYCIYAGSFVHYLEGQFGREAVLRIYKGEDFTEITGMSFDGCKAMWLETIK